MANLEKTLAEIEVLADEMWSRYSSARGAEDSFRAGRTLDGIKKDAELVYKKCADTYSALRKGDFVSASSAFSEMALDSQNLADNLGIFLQTVYGNQSGNLKSLESNTRTAPKVNEQQTIYQRFLTAYDTSKNSLMKRARDSKGHNRGHAILFKTQNQPGLAKDKPYYLIFSDERSHEEVVTYLSHSFFEGQARAYLEMTKTILQTVADKDQEHFRPKDKKRKLKTNMQRVRNFYQRHAGILRTISGTALLVGGLVGGSLGTLAYEQHQREKEMKATLVKMDLITDLDGKLRSYYDMWELGFAEEVRRELIEKRRIELQAFMMAHTEYVASYNMEKVFGAKSNLFETISNGLEVKSARLGAYVDNYISRASVNPTNVIGETRKFLDRRTKFKKELKHFYEETRGKVPNYAALERLNILFREEKDLESMESSIVSGFPHGQLR